MQPTNSDGGPLPEQALSADEAVLRDQCERSARQQYPGARVLVERDPRGVVAGVVLPEDGSDLDVSAVSAGPCPSPREALQALAQSLLRPLRTLKV